MLRGVVWIDSSPTDLALVATNDETAEFGLLTGDIADASITNLETLKSATSGRVFLDANFAQLTSTGVGKAKTNNAILEVYGANTKDNITNSDKYISGYTAEDLIPAVILYQNAMSS